MTFSTTNEATGSRSLPPSLMRRSAQPLMEYVPGARGPSASSASFWIWRSPQEERRRQRQRRRREFYEVCEEQRVHEEDQDQDQDNSIGAPTQEEEPPRSSWWTTLSSHYHRRSGGASTLVSSAASLRMRRLLLRPLAMLIVGYVISSASNRTHIQRYHNNNKNSNSRLRAVSSSSTSMDMAWTTWTTTASSSAVTHKTEIISWPETKSSSSSSSSSPTSILSATSSRNKAAYPAIAWAKAQSTATTTTTATDINDTNQIPPNENEETTDPAAPQNPQLYGWEPIVYPNPTEDPLRCGIAYLTGDKEDPPAPPLDPPDMNANDNGTNTNTNTIMESTPSVDATTRSFEFASTSSSTSIAHTFETMDPPLQLCDPDWVLGGTYLEQIAQALAMFSKQFSHPPPATTTMSMSTTGSPVDEAVSTPPTWQFWNAQRHQRRRIAEGKDDDDDDNDDDDDDDHQDYETRSTVTPTSHMPQKIINDQVENERSDHAGVVVEASSDDTDLPSHDQPAANPKHRNQKKTKTKAAAAKNSRPPIELAVATVRKVSDLHACQTNEEMEDETIGRHFNSRLSFLLLLLPR